MEDAAQIVVLQPTISESPVRTRATRGNIIVYPERQVLPEASRADDGEGIRHKKISSRHVSRRLYGLWLVAVPIEIPFIAKGNRNSPGNFARVHGFRESLLLRFGAEQYRLLLDKRVVVCRKLKTTLLEG